MRPATTIKTPLPKIIKSANQFPVVGIGASAGGLEAFKKLIKAIPENSGMAYVLVQHLDPNHESLLPELLQKVTSIPVLVISDEIRVEPNHIYVIPSNKMLMATDGVLKLTARGAISKNKLNLPIDFFFTSLAEVHRSHAIGVVLSGTASDGTAGLKAIKDHGGITFAQDEASAAFESMPHSAAQAGVVDFILPPGEIPQKILEIIRSAADKGHNGHGQPLTDDEVYKQIIALLRLRKGTDFTYYKQTTIRRRIQRRMALNKNDEPAGYLVYLKENKPEQDVLYQDMLIPVTSFFRDPKSFDNLCKTVFPLIIKNKSAGKPVRVWVAGCSTGEEVYSIAICLKEVLAGGLEGAQIFATDISEPAIAKARSGIYTKKELVSVTPQRLNAFFTKNNSNYQVNKPLRDMCVFAVHNFIKDPPFGKIDFISCRNVLIYMEPYLQKRALTTFHYSLNPKGFLLLGKSETSAGVPDLLASASKNDKLYSRKDVPGRFTHVPSQRNENSPNQTEVNMKKGTVRADFQKTADDILLSKYTPASVIVNEAMDIVLFRGNTDSYLSQSSGKPSHNLMKMAKDGLAFELRSILHKAKKEKVAVTKENIPLQINGSLSNISIEAVPLPNVIEPHYLILFRDTHAAGVNPLRANSKKTSQGKTKSDGKDLRIQQLEQELAQTREDMRGITEEQEATNEELQTDNEELLSGSEELQSLNEELETSKEELQSTNEELTVLNQEVINLNERVTEARDYSEAIVANVREPLLVLDKNLCVKTANNSYYKAFRVNIAETEGKLIYEVGNRQWDIPALRKLLENILPEKSKFEDFEIIHTFSNIGERVMLLNARELIKETSSEKLILLAFEDITEQKKAEEIQKQIEKRFHFIADAMPQKVWTADANGNVNYFNNVWLTYTGLGFEELKDWGWKKIVHPDDWEEHSKRWQHSIDTGNNFELEHRLLNKDGEYKWHLSRNLVHKDENGKITMWIGTGTEIQEQRKQKQDLEQAVVERTYELQQASENLVGKNDELEKMNIELQSFAHVSSHDLQEPLRKIQTFAARILEREMDNLSEKGKDDFNRMRSAAGRMQQLIEDLLAFSHLNTTERKFENTALEKIVSDVKSELKEMIEEKHAVIEIGEMCEAHIIPFQFHQLMHNLVSNALKFSSPLPAPHISIKSIIVKGYKLIYDNPAIPQGRLAPEKLYCHISVADNGIGFEPEYNERIFAVFQKLHGKEEYAGTGIGLSIVKKIVENHNGIIIATGKLGKGAIFDIYIPA